MIGSGIKRDCDSKTSWRRFALVTLSGLATTVISASSALALDVAKVLPANVASPAFRSGVISGVGFRYTTDGTLMSLNDYHSIEFDTKTLAKIEPRVQELVAALNQFGGQNLGDALNLGVLKVKTAPEVRYFAPLYAYGVSERLTLAVGLPVVRYENHMSLEQEGSNVTAVRTSVGRVSQDLNAAFDQLSVNLASSAQNELMRKGYKPIADRNETIVGDVQLASLYQFYNSPEWSGLFKTIVNLPTGPGDDPDDLADLGVFGQAAIEPQVVATTQLKRLTLAAKGSIRYTLPDKIVKRVPESEDDSLPGVERKELVSRQTGLAGTVGMSGSYRVLSRVSTGVGYEYSQKAADEYRGERGWNYGLLSRDSETASERVRLGMSYDSTEAYMRQETPLPAIVSYEFSDMFRGRNLERQTIHEIWVTLFF